MSSEIYLSDMQAAEVMRSFDALDPEHGHGCADNLLCDLLRVLGYSETVKEFKKLTKWYS